MNYSIFICFFLITFRLSATEIEQINNTVLNLFLATDQRDWEQLENIFHKKVELDYSSMTGIPSDTVYASDIISNWKNVLPGFKFTHHQIGNIITNVIGDKAMVFCYGTATHFLENDKGNIWTVFGYYDLELLKESDKWRVSKMRFNYKFQDGNTELPNMALDNLRKK